MGGRVAMLTVCPLAPGSWGARCSGWGGARTSQFFQPCHGKSICLFYFPAMDPGQWGPRLILGEEGESRVVSTDWGDYVTPCSWWVDVCPLTINPWQLLGVWIGGW